MITDLRRVVARAVVDAVAAVTGETIDVPAVEEPPRPEFGDLAIPAALELGRRLGRPPRQLAEELLEWLEANPAPGVSRWQIASAHRLLTEAAPHPWRPVFPLSSRAPSSHAPPSRAASRAP